MRHIQQVREVKSLYIDCSEHKGGPAPGTTAIPLRPYPNGDGYTGCRSCLKVANFFEKILKLGL